MNDSRRDGDVTPGLERLSSVVNRRADRAIWRAFLVAQIAVRDTNRRREMTTQRIFLLGQHER